ncbi:MAG: head GIN domain-containing protein [Patiriisocius sp.]|uniref:head GIN domain-containing protein n=1 Tax=Patiriisocius sp. TaxID=2822396 RepID=UPI003EF23220
MKTTKIVIMLLGVLSINSCIGDFNINRVNGNGDVVVENRSIGNDFDGVKGSSGLEVILTQGTENALRVEADSNLQNMIETYVDDNTLYIKTEGNIGDAAKKTVYVTYTTLSSIKASSGANVSLNNEFKNEKITLDASSGANITASIFSKDAYVETSSGANINVEGKTKTLRTKASSGGHIDAKDLLSVSCNAKASSGGNITVNTKDELEVKTSSGGQVNYTGDPIVKNNSSKHNNNVSRL